MSLSPDFLMIREVCISGNRNADGVVSSHLEHIFPSPEILHDHGTGSPDDYRPVHQWDRITKIQNW
jgi:hypothetical protein